MPVMANDFQELEIHASNIMFVVNFCYFMIGDYAEEDIFWPGGENVNVYVKGAAALNENLLEA